MPDRRYTARDLKFIYASGECADMRLDPMETNLVVEDGRWMEKTICLAVSSSLKDCGVTWWCSAGILAVAEDC